MNIALRSASRPSLRQSVAETVAEHPHLLMLTGVLLIAGLAHGINLGRYPYYENDEGAYISQAWSLINQGKLAPYTYWYDHAPGGWIQIAGWVLLTGGFHTAGNSVTTVRLLMLVMQLLSTALVFRIATRVTGKGWVGLLASLLYCVSAYGIYYHRRVLVDNITTFWMLLAIDVLLARTVSLYRVWFSGLALGIAILSKEIAMFLIPAIGALVFMKSDPRLRWMALVTWSSIGAAIVSLYVLLAALKGELFPAGTLLGGTARHVSLVCSLQYQASRGRDGGILSMGSGFWLNMKHWVLAEPLLVLGGTAAAVACVLLVRRRMTAGIIGLCCLSLWLFMARGGIVISFYLLPLLPLLAICFAVAVEMLTQLSRKRWVAGAVTAVCLASAVGGVVYSYADGDAAMSPGKLWQSQESEAQLQAKNWLIAHVPDGSSIVMDDSLWTDVHDGSTGHSYRLAHWYWKVDRDPAIHDQVFDGDWRRVDYVVASPQMISDAQRAHLALVTDAVIHSRPIIAFDTGGWPIEIREVDRSGKLYGLPRNFLDQTTLQESQGLSNCTSST